ncbi:WD repeat-containing protein 1, partial [Irineochytrium annulatum]
ATYPPQPATVRGQAVHLGEDPKGVNFLYTNGRSVIIRNLENPAIATEYTGHSSHATVARDMGNLSSVALTNCNAKTMADVQGNIRIWDTTQVENILKTETRALSGRVNDLSWDFESKRLIAVGDGKDRFGHAFLFDTASSVGEISGHSKSINSVSIRPGRPLRAVTCSDDMTVNFYHGVPFKFNRSIKDHSRFVQCARFSPSGDHFATSGMDGKIFIYDGKTGDKVSELTGGDGTHTGGIFSISWSPDGASLLSCSADTTAKIWDVSAKKAVSSFGFSDAPGAIEDQQVGCLWSGKHIITLSLSGDINYLDRSSSSGRPARVVRGHQKAITALTVRPDKGTFVSGSYDGR